MPSCLLQPPRNKTARSARWVYRLDAATNRSLVGAARGAYVEQLTRRPVAPGVLAYDGADVVGWAAVAPRADLPFARSRKIPHVDGLPVWSAWCQQHPAGRDAPAAALLIAQQGTPGCT